MEFKKSFDIMEAAVLMDIYMYAKEHGISASKTAIEASERLRSLALGKGYDINKSFRSVPGIQNRLRTLASMYENKNSSGYPGTNIFAEIIDMYHYNDITVKKAFVRFGAFNDKPKSVFSSKFAMVPSASASVYLFCKYLFKPENTSPQ